MAMDRVLKVIEHNTSIHLYMSNILSMKNQTPTVIPPPGPVPQHTQQRLVRSIALEISYC